MSYQFYDFLFCPVKNGEVSEHIDQGNASHSYLEFVESVIQNSFQGLTEQNEMLNYPRLEGLGFEIIGRPEVDLRFIAFRVSFLRKQESRTDRENKETWIPAFAGMTYYVTLQWLMFTTFTFRPISLRLKARGFHHPRRGH
jgi:hypothetical protein